MLAIDLCWGLGSPCLLVPEVDPAVFAEANAVLDLVSAVRDGFCSLLTFYWKLQLARGAG